MKIAPQDTIYLDHLLVMLVYITVRVKVNPCHQIKIPKNKTTLQNYVQATLEYTMYITQLVTVVSKSI